MLTDTAVLTLFYIIPMVLAPVQLYVRYREEKAYVEANHKHYGPFDPHSRKALTYGEVLFLLLVATIPVANVATVIGTAVLYPPRFLRTAVVKVPTNDTNEGNA